MTPKQRESVLRKFNGHCAYCGKEITLKTMQVDHVWPKWRDGTDDDKNLFPSCRRCNHYKRGGTVEYLREMLKDMRRKVLDDTYLGNVAMDYGMVKWKGWDEKFYFERQTEESQ